MFFLKFGVPSYLADIITETDFTGQVWVQYQVLIVYIVDSNYVNRTNYKSS